MPLHLLHHKSYHVYSTTNIERVRRDEAAARAKEEAEEQRMQEADAEHRIRVLRARVGGTDTQIPTGDKHEPPDATITGRFIAPRESAQISENEIAIVRRQSPLPPAKRRKASPSLTGADGHINLFNDVENPKRRKAEKNSEYEAEKKAKEDKLEAQYTMGLGKPAEELNPWYSNLDMVGEVKGRKRTDREMGRDERNKDWGDPLVAIKKGVRGVKEVEGAREEWKRARELEVGAAGLRALEMRRIGATERASSSSQEYRRRRDKSLETHHDRSRHRSRSTGGNRHRNRSHKHDKSESGTETKSHRHRQHYRSSRSRSPRCEQRPGNDLMEKLRRERDRREKAEREKAEAMLSREKEYRLPGWKAVDGGRYSSQFGIGEVRKR